MKTQRKNNNLETTSLFIGELSNATKKLYDNLEAARPLFLKLEGLIIRALTTHAGFTEHCSKTA